MKRPPPSASYSAAALDAKRATSATITAWLGSLPTLRKTLHVKIAMLGIAELLRQPLESIPAAARVSRGGAPAMSTLEMRSLPPLLSRV